MAFSEIITGMSFLSPITTPSIFLVSVVSALPFGAGNLLPSGSNSGFGGYSSPSFAASFFGSYFITGNFYVEGDAAAVASALMTTALSSQTGG